MNATQLLEHFDRLAEAPGAVARLRRFILELAVRGRLVEQDDEDEPGLMLLQQIHIEKARSIKKGATRMTIDAAVVAEDSYLFDIPNSWVWTNLAEIADFSAGRTPPRHEAVFWNSGEYPWVSIRDMKAGETLLDTSETVSETAKLKVFGSEPAPAGTLIMSFKLTIGRVSRLGIPAFHNEAIISIYPRLQSLDPYLFKTLPLFAQSGNSKDAIKGATLNRESLSNIPIALPPLAEQHRIVAKVDELMALCDQLEAAQQERERRRDRLAAASLQRLNQPALEVTPETQREHARFHLNHLPRLTTRPAHIKSMRQTILNLAVLGLLSESNHWALTSQPLKSAATLQNGYAFKSEWFVKTGTRLLRNTNVGHGIIGWDEMACLPIEQSVEYERFQLNDGDVVLSLDRPFIGTGTKVARVRAKDLPCLLLQRVGRFQLNHSLLIADYLFLWIESPQFTNQIDPGRSNGVPHISSKQVESAEIYLPPLAEQHRIVAKVDELMALCDQLEAQLTTTQTDSRRLLEAVLGADV
jgi:type I restriction enzyme, S subunit